MNESYLKTIFALSTLYLSTQNFTSYYDTDPISVLISLYVEGYITYDIVFKNLEKIDTYTNILFYFLKSKLNG